MIDISLIQDTIEKFELNLKGKTILTEAASGNYVVTPIIAALARAKVYALTKNSKYASVQEVIKQTNDLADKLKIKDKIRIITNLNELDLKEIDVLTNTGFNRPIDKKLIDRLSSNCVIPLMWEPWEFRESDLDIDYCYEKGIKVYGTNESDDRLKTMDYIGFTVLYFLLKQKKTPTSSKILILGDNHFGKSVYGVLTKNGYNTNYVNTYDQKTDTGPYNVIVFAEHVNNKLLIGKDGFIDPNNISDKTILIHIAGNVDFKNATSIKIPENPAPFGYMSYTTDYIDPMAVIDLHTAGLKVAEGMLLANEKKLEPVRFKEFLESGYPALAFSEKKYW